jgi:hypothetical protein
MADFDVRTLHFYGRFAVHLPEERIPYPLDLGGFRLFRLAAVASPHERLKSAGRPSIFWAGWI